jgi:hypothetical protein
VPSLSECRAPGSLSVTGPIDRLSGRLIPPRFPRSADELLTGLRLDDDLYPFDRLQSRVRHSGVLPRTVPESGVPVALKDRRERPLLTEVLRATTVLPTVVVGTSPAADNLPLIGSARNEEAAAPERRSASVALNVIAL